MQDKLLSIFNNRNIVLSARNLDYTMYLGYIGFCDLKTQKHQINARNLDYSMYLGSTG
jgi:hypothetical protein